MRCARLAAPFVTALCIFDTLRGGSAARRSHVMVSIRACSSPMPQPASRHSIKPFSIQPIIANIRHSAVSTSQYRFAIWGRRCGECPFEYTPQRISRSESGWGRIFAMMMLLFCPWQQAYKNRNLSDARPIGRLRQATFWHILRVTSANPLHKGGEAFRGL